MNGKMEPIRITEDLLERNGFSKVLGKPIYKWKRNSNEISIDLEGVEDSYVSNLRHNITGNFQYSDELQKAIDSAEIDFKLK